MKAQRKPVEERAGLTVEEAAELLGIGRSLAWELVWSGEIPSLRFRRRVVVPRAQLEAMLAGRDPQAPQEKREAGFPASEPLADEDVDGQRSTAP